MLAGKRLFTAENPLALVDMMMTRAIPRLDEVRPELGAPVADLCAAMLVRERDERTITASEAANRLEQLARDAQGSAAREVIGALVRERAGASLTELEKTIRARAQELPTLPQSAPAAAATTPPSTLSRTLGIAVVVLLVLVLGITVWRGPGDDTGERAPTNGSTATNEGTTNDGSTQEASTSAMDEAATSATNEGTTNEGTTNEGATNEGTTNEGTMNEGTTRETTAVASGRDEGTRASTGRGDRRGGRAGDDDAGTPAAAQGIAAPASSETSTSETRTTMDEPPAPTGLLGVEDFDRGGEHAP